MSYLGFSQDTINFIKYNDGSKSFCVQTKKDTIIYNVYANGRKESERLMKNGEVSGVYTRWYENGKLMWQKNLLSNLHIYYDKNGKKVAILKFKGDMVSDTLFIKKNMHLILGKIMFSSKVYGGVQRPDGGSNISENSGAYHNCNMYAAKIDSIHKPQLIQYFKSDYKGDFFVCVPNVTVGIFPNTIPIKDLNTKNYYPIIEKNRSGDGSWDMLKPIEIKNKSIVSVTLKYSSVAYAP